jgi:hypothetical protein
MTATVIRFPRHPVRIIRDETRGDWLVEWRGWYWAHTSYASALTDAHRIAAAHNERVIDDAREDAFRRRMTSPALSYATLARLRNGMRSKVADVVCPVCSVTRTGAAALRGFRDVVELHSGVSDEEPPPDDEFRLSGSPVAQT